MVKQAGKLDRSIAFVLSDLKRPSLVPSSLRQSDFEPGTVARNSAAPAGRARRRPSRRTAAPAPVSRPWTDRQERLALLYNEQGLRPDEIAAKLGVSTYLATQIVLAARDRRRPEVPAVLRSDPSPRTRKPA